MPKKPQVKQTRNPSPREKSPPPAPNRPEVDVAPSRCARPSCGSTERERYSTTQVQAFAGRDEQGRPFTHIVRRWTRCKACGQARVDRSFENRIETDLDPADLAELIAAGDPDPLAENGDAAARQAAPSDAELAEAAGQAEADLDRLAGQLGAEAAAQKPATA